MQMPSLLAKGRQHQPHNVLCHHTARFGPLPEAITRSYTRQLLLGLEYLHARK